MKEKIKKDEWKIVLALLVLSVVGWYLNTGTLAPYAATLQNPFIDEKTGLMGNWDDAHHMAVMDFLEGNESYFSDSVMLRRPLHAWLCLPFSGSVSYRYCGVLLNLILYLMAVLFAWHTICVEEGACVARYSLMLLCTYPGFSYWSGLPYCYGIIAPGTLFCYSVLRRAGADRAWKSIVSMGLTVGLVFLGYDLYVIFLPSLWLLLAWGRLWIAFCIYTILSMLPLVLWLFAVRFSGVPLANSNSEIYTTIVKAYLTGDVLLPDGEFLSQLLRSALWSQFLFLPCFCAVGLVMVRSRCFIRLPEVCLGLSLLSLFSFLNLAPQYDGWQMRGDYMNRLFQPAFPIFVVVLARVAATFGRMGTSLVFCCSLMQFLVVSSGFTGSEMLSRCYEKFYPHSSAGTYKANVEHFGRVPLGFEAPAEMRSGGEAGEAG